MALMPMDHAAALQFLTAIFPAGVVVELRAWPVPNCTRKDGTTAPAPTAAGDRKRWAQVPEELPDALRWAAAMNAGGLNVGCCIFPHERGRSGKDAGRPGRVVWADVDGLTDPAELARRIAEAGMPAPYMVNDSGNGLHAYWMLPAVAGVAPVCDAVLRVERAIGGDEIAHGDKVMRLPGTVNHNWGNLPACRILTTADAVTDLLTLTRTLPPVEVKPSPSASAVTGAAGVVATATPDNLRRGRAAVERADTIAAGGRNLAAFRMAAYLLKDCALPPTIARELLGQWGAAKCAPPLDTAELDAVLTNAARYGTHAVGAKVQRRPPSASACAIYAALWRQLTAVVPGDDPVLPDLLPLTERGISPETAAAVGACRMTDDAGAWLQTRYTPAALDEAGLLVHDGRGGARLLWAEGDALLPIGAEAALGLVGLRPVAEGDAVTTPAGLRRYPLTVKLTGGSSGAVVVVRGVYDALAVAQAAPDARAVVGLIGDDGLPILAAWCKRERVRAVVTMPGEGGAAVVAALTREGVTASADPLPDAAWKLIRERGQ